jgi:hypothetical protein
MHFFYDAIEPGANSKYAYLIEACVCVGHGNSSHQAKSSNLNSI